MTPKKPTAAERAHEAIERASNCPIIMAPRAMQDHTDDCREAHAALDEALREERDKADKETATCMDEAYRTGLEKGRKMTEGEFWAAMRQGAGLDAD